MTAETVQESRSLDGEVDWDPTWDEEEDFDTAAAQIADDEVHLFRYFRGTILDLTIRSVQYLSIFCSALSL